ncbi:MAG: ABC transporter ATP-binding protein [Bacteriovoracia bacterium]
MDVELVRITKKYGDFCANNEISFSVKSGSIHALVGENGAGKSTLMKILFGLTSADSGEIWVNQEKQENWNSKKAIQYGIGMVHQHFMLSEPDTVLDNIVLGYERSRLGFRKTKQEKIELEQLMRTTGLYVPLDEKVENLSLGLRSRIEILKVLYRKAKFLILDEPTAVLTPLEIEAFLETLRTLRKQGHTVLIITHKLKEVMAVSDRITVLRKGAVVKSEETVNASIDQLSEWIVGRKLHLPKVQHDLPGVKRDFSSHGSCLSIETRNGIVVRAPFGMITGIAGVEGNGQAELISSILSPKKNKVKISLFGQDASALETQDLRKLPIAVIPSDRQEEGLVLEFSLFENLRLGRKQVKKQSLDWFGRATKLEQELLEENKVNPPKVNLTAKSLSGGNQQKLIFARELDNLPQRSFILAVNPTRGVDVGSIEHIHETLLEKASQGAAILLISSELDELVSLSHQIGVLFRSKIVQWFEGPNYSEHSIGVAMNSGAKSHGASRFYSDLRMVENVT